MKEETRLVLLILLYPTLRTRSDSQSIFVRAMTVTYSNATLVGHGGHWSQTGGQMRLRLAAQSCSVKQASASGLWVFSNPAPPAGPAGLGTRLASLLPGPASRCFLGSSSGFKAILRSLLLVSFSFLKIDLFLVSIWDGDDFWYSVLSLMRGGP